MKIGDKVRFLNDVGGGEIAAFQGKNIVVVRDEDGFEVPTLRSEVVVIATNELNLVQQTFTDTPAEAAQSAATRDTEPADRPITFTPKPIERRGGERLNLCFGFVPIDPKTVGNTAFECYLINDSNYYLHYAISHQEGAVLHLRHQGVIAPNTKDFLEEFERDVLGEWERLTVQCFAYKTDKAFAPKPALSAALRMDTTKFYKLHTFHANDFFDEPSLIVDIVRDDKPVRAIMVSPEELKAKMMERPADSRQSQPARQRQGQSRPDSTAIVQIDLHTAELLDSTAGMTPSAILDYQLGIFHQTMAQYAKDKGRRIVFIHGKGEGVLRQAILRELKAKYPQCTHQDASFREYGFGATMVTIHA
ncbi:MAG: DUF2027 domain-containing protein [Bacteroidales bacterium]|nr:DUF2027 domain-containing protein [Candidatus Equimonas enterica]